MVVVGAVEVAAVAVDLDPVDIDLVFDMTVSFLG